MKAVLGWFGAHVVAILLTIAIVAALMFAWSFIHPTPPPNAQADRVRVDTIKVWKLVQDTNTVRVDHFVADTRQSAATGRTAAARLDSAARVTVDTSPAHAYALEKERGDTLERLSLGLSVALDTMTADRDRWRFVADTSVALLGHVQHDLEIATRPCRIARYIPCPSRAVVFVGTALATGLIVTHPDATKNLLRNLNPLH